MQPETMARHLAVSTLGMTLCVSSALAENVGTLEARVKQLEQELASARAELAQAKQSEADLSEQNRQLIQELTLNFGAITS